MALFVLHKPNSTRMCSHPMVVGPFVYFHTSCVWTDKALARLRRWAGSPEPSLVAYVISTVISWAVSFHVETQLCWMSVKPKIFMVLMLLCLMQQNFIENIFKNSGWNLFYYFGSWTRNRHVSCKHLTKRFWPLGNIYHFRIHIWLVNQNILRIQVDL